MHTKNFDINEEGYSVRCKFFSDTDSRSYERVVICTHGYGGSKDNASIRHFAEKYLAKNKKDAVISFDWPCHGQDARKKLVLSECLEYLDLVIRYAQDTLKAEKICNYSVSFGGYITLLYIAKKGCPFEKVALRCPALRMYELMKRNVAEADLPKLEKGKDVMIGYSRKIKIDRTLLEELKAGDVREHEYFDVADRMIILHGTKDETVPIEDSEQFAENNVIEFIPVEKADHPFRDPRCMDFAIHTIVEFFAPEK